MISKSAMTPNNRRRRPEPPTEPAPRRVDPHRRGRRRLALLALVFVGSMAAVGVRFAELASQNDGAPEVERVQKAEPRGETARAEIRDRNGLTLATDIRTYELYLDSSVLHFPRERAEAVSALATLFPDINRQDLTERVERRGTTLVKWPISPSAAQAAHNLGIPGLYYLPRVDRLYPTRALASHVVGWASLDGVGKAGVELGLEPRISVENAAPLDLSIDMRVQRIVRARLMEAMRDLTARAAVGIVLDVDSGETLALASLPDYDPHARPPQPTGGGSQEASPLFHRAAKGRYELGSVFKIFTWALAMERRVSGFSETFPIPQPLRVDSHTIRDSHPFTTPLSFADAFAKSSNVIAAELALRAGREAQAQMFRALGLNAPTGLETIEARGVEPSWNEHWSDTATATTAFGHGVAATPMHLAAATATIVNGGLRVRPTLLKQDPETRRHALDRRPRAISPQTSRAMRDLMRYAVTNGTGKAADANGFMVGGKTGTAEKPDPRGGYDSERVLSTFVAAFPIDAPRYVVLVMLDEPTDMSTGRPVRGAGATAAPVVGALIPAIAPLLGVAPRLASDIATASTD